MKLRRKKNDVIVPVIAAPPPQEVELLEEHYLYLDAPELLDRLNRQEERINELKTLSRPTDLTFLEAEIKTLQNQEVRATIEGDAVVVYLKEKDRVLEESFEALYERVNESLHRYEDLYTVFESHEHRLIDVENSAEQALTGDAQVS